MNCAERGFSVADSRSPDDLALQDPPRSELEHYTLIQAAITAESLAALAGHGIAISFRQSACGGYVATLLHCRGGGIDSGLCPSLLEARRLVLGHGQEESP